MKKINKKGFSLIEVLAIIVIISLIFGIGFYYFNNIIKNTDTTNNKINYNNIKLGARDYIKEFKKDIVWDENKVCVSPQTLVSKGFLDKKTLEKTKEVKSIIIEKDNSGKILSEQIDTVKDCDTYLTTVSIPKSSDICNERTYTGNNIDLIKSESEIGNDFKVYYKDNSYNNNAPINAGKYEVILKLLGGKKWEDGTNKDKEIICTIKKKSVDLELEPKWSSSEKLLNKTEVKVFSETSGSLTIKTSNKKHVTGEVNTEVKNPNTSNSYGFYGIVDIIKHANRNTTTYITITINPDSSNYEKTSIVYTVGNINEEVIKKVPKPTNAICNKNNKYTGDDIALVNIKENDPYTVEGNIQSEIGSYPIKLSLKYGYIWEDGSSDDITINCDIVSPTLEVIYENAICNPQSIMVTYGDTYGKNQKLCVPTEKEKTFEGWYIDNNYITKVDEDTIVENPNNHKLYAKWSSGNIKEFEHGTYLCTEKITYMVSIFLNEKQNLSEIMGNFMSSGMNLLGSNTPFCYNEKELVNLVSSDCSGFLGEWPFASVYVHKKYISDMNKIKSENIEGDYVFGYIPLQIGMECMTTLPCPGSEQFKKKWCK